MHRPTKATFAYVTADASRAGWILRELHVVHVLCKVLTWHSQVPN